MTRFTTAWHRTPVGDVLLVFDAHALVSASVEHDPRPVAMERTARMLQSVPEHDDRAARDVAAQLDDYFSGERRDFDIALDWRFAHGFTREALEVVRGIPYGETASYGEVAALAGRPRAARAVGAACRMTPFSIVVPVHRVVRADGSMGEYGAHPEVKAALLSLERDTLERAAVV